MTRDKPRAPKGIKEASRLAGLIKDRLVAQYEKALREDRLDELALDFGYHSQMIAALEDEVEDPMATYAAMINTVTIFMQDFVTMESHDKNSGADCIKSLVDLWVGHLQRGTI